MWPLCVLSRKLLVLPVDVDADRGNIEDYGLCPELEEKLPEPARRKALKVLHDNDVYTTEIWAAIKRRSPNESLIVRYGEYLVVLLDELSGIAPAVAPAAPAGANAIAEVYALLSACFALCLTACVTVNLRCFASLSECVRVLCV
jgi:hypothetical protein